MEDAELAERSIRGFGEMFAVLADGVGGPEAVVRRPDAVGGKLGRTDLNPFFDSAVVPAGVTPPPDDPGLPHYVWAQANQLAGRVEEPASVIPCLGAWLSELELRSDGELELRSDGELELRSDGERVVLESAPLDALGEMNEQAYGESGFLPIARAIRDPRARSHGARVGGELVTVALTVEVGSDLGIHYVVTRKSRRSRGLASGLVRALSLDARERGLRSATLQASEQGRRVWERLGFREVAVLHAHVRPTPVVAS